ncbi:MAG: hypothetical protein AMXMBFR45_20570 [Gammaproteobacteria bacterium]|jgi:hypothetical protein|nr:MAG: hypothetical protein EDM71_05355 [Pseudomonadota bacterium]MBC6944638.1 hypothetical protein [Gammaproteobacteria bacterium]
MEGRRGAPDDAGDQGTISMSAELQQDRVAPAAGILSRFYQPPYVGAFAFVAVLGIVPIMHSLLSLVTDNFPPGHETAISIGLGAIAIAMVIYASARNSEALGTWFGFIAGHLVWTGWIELSFRFNPEYIDMGPLVVNGEKVLSPSLLFVQATVGLLMATLPFFVFNRDTRCNAFRWIQRVTRYDAGKPATAADRNFARITFLEVLYVIWFCYAVSLFLVDTRFVGSHHPITYVAGFIFIAWTFYLLMRLAKFTRVLAGVRYAIPTAGIFWTAVEFAHEWGLYDEFWSKPQEYALEMGMVLGAFVLALLLAVVMPARRASGTKAQAQSQA